MRRRVVLVVALVCAVGFAASASAPVWQHVHAPWTNYYGGRAEIDCGTIRTPGYRVLWQDPIGPNGLAGSIPPGMEPCGAPRSRAAHRDLWLTIGFGVATVLLGFWLLGMERGDTGREEHEREADHSGSG